MTNREATDEDDRPPNADINDRAEAACRQLVDEFHADSCVILTTHYNRATGTTGVHSIWRGNWHAVVGSVEVYRRKIRKE